MSVKGDSSSSTNASSSPKSTYSIQSDDKSLVGTRNEETRSDYPPQENNRRDIVVITRVASDETLESQSSTSSVGIRPDPSFSSEDIPPQARAELNNRVRALSMNNINKYHPVRFSKSSERRFKNDEPSEANNLNDKAQSGPKVQLSTQEDRVLEGDKSNPQATPSLNIAEFPTDKLAS